MFHLVDRRARVSKARARKEMEQVIGNIRFFTIGMCCLAAAIWNQKLVTESNRMRILLTDLVGIAGSRRAFESCRVGVQSRKLLSQVLPQQSGRPTLVRFGRTKRNQATYVSLGLV